MLPFSKLNETEQKHGEGIYRNGGNTAKTDENSARGILGGEWRWEEREDELKEDDLPNIQGKEPTIWELPQHLRQMSSFMLSQISK